MAKNNLYIPVMQFSDFLNERYEKYFDYDIEIIIVI